MNRDTAQSSITSIRSFFTVLCVFVFPLICIPVPFLTADLAKWLFLLCISLVLICLASLELLRTKSITFSFHQGALAFGVLSASMLISLVFASGNKTEAVLHTLGIGSAVSCLIVMILSARHDETYRHTLSWAVVVSAFLLALFAIYQFFGLSRLFPTLVVLQNPLWTLAGTSIALVTYLTYALSIAYAQVIHAWRTKHEAETVFAVVSILALIAGIALTIYQMIPTISQTTLPFKDGWSVLLETYKNPLSAIIGVGAENFITAFTAGRPLRLNTGPLWNIRFGASSNMLFHMATVFGALGFISIIVICRSIWLRVRDNHLYIPAAIFTTAILLFAPPHIVTYGIIISFFLITFTHHTRTIRVSMYQWLIALVLGITIFTSLYGIIRATAAEIVNSRSLTQAQTGNGTQAYKLQQQAIQFNPAITQYHINGSQLSLRIAQAVYDQSRVATGSAQPVPLTDENKNLISSLVRVAIQEAKIATSLAPSRVTAWEQLAAVYQSIIPIAQGADAWAIASFQKALDLDRSSPSLRVSLGMLYNDLGRWDEAITQFIVAIRLKPDLRNAYYNLAQSYKAKGDTDKAVNILTQAFQLVAPGSEDYTIITDEIKQLENARVPAVPSPTPAIEPLIDVTE